METPSKIFIIKIALGVAVFACSFLAVGISHAATSTWTGGGADNNWDTAANWTPSGKPGSGVDVTFDSSTGKNCTIDTAVNVKSITITSGYTGTNTQSSGNNVTGGGKG